MNNSEHKKDILSLIVGVVLGVLSLVLYLKDLLYGKSLIILFVILALIIFFLFYKKASYAIMFGSGMLIGPLLATVLFMVFLALFAVAGGGDFFRAG